MAAMSDASIGISTESVYGTSTTVNRWYEFTEENLTVVKEPVQGQGLRVGSKVARSARRVVPLTGGKGDFTVEMTTKGMGLLLQACLGTATSTLSTGSCYQQVFTLGDSPNSLTVQKGIVDTTGAVWAHTFKGTMVEKWELSAGNGEIVTLKVDLDSREVDTSTTYTTPSYVATPSLYHFAHGAIAIGGTVTAPTTTVSATGGTSVANIRDFTISGENSLNADRYNFGGAGKKSKPLPGLRKISGKVTAEYVDNVLRDAYLADTELAMLLTFTSTEAVTGGFATLQVVLPAVKFNGEVPGANGTDLVTLDCSFDVLDNLTAAQPIYVVLRTNDTAL